MKKILIMLSMLFVLLLAVGASADSLTIGTPNNALSPYPGPYGTLEWSIDVTGKIATFDFKAAGNTGTYTYYIINGQAADLNINAPSFTAANPTTLTGVSGFPAPVFKQYQYNSNAAVDGFGKFNLVLDLESANDPASEIKFSVTRTDTGTWASAADVLTATSQGFLAAMHIQVFLSSNVNPSAQLTTGFAANGSVPVPEPGILILLGIAMSAIGAASWKISKL